MPSTVYKTAEYSLPPRGIDLVPVEKLRRLSSAELYPYLGEFYHYSRTFKHYWDMGCETHRSEEQTSWNTVADDACMLAQSFRHFVENDWIWFHERCPNVSYTSFEKICNIAKEVYEDKETKKLFYLMIYARDFGWVATKSRQFHQSAGVPILHYILGELNFNSTQIAEIKNWVRQHSMPAETFLGEVSPHSVKDLINTYTDEVPTAKMLALLSLLEVNCIRKDTSALYEDNTSTILSYADRPNHDVFISWLQDQRLFRLCVPRMKTAKTTPSEGWKLEKDTLKRFVQISHFLERLGSDDQVRLQKFMEEVDLHYVASTFPKMKVSSIARFLTISAQKCIPNVTGPTEYFHVVNKNKALFRELDEILSSELSDYEIKKKYVTVEGESVVWDLNRR